MGCDIHMMVELKRSIDGKEIWVNYDHFRKNPYFELFEDEEEYERIELCRDRNYTAFSQLCGVRAYSTGTPMIAEPRGIPSDASEYTKSVSDRWDSDGHSHSHVTLAEIRAFRADLKPMPFNGMISEEQSADLDKGILPQSWCGWTSIPGFVHREWMDTVDGLKWIHEALETRAIEHWWRAEQIKPEDIRIVFFFDN